MRAFFSPTRIWPAGWTRPHLYVLPDLTRDTALADLIAATRTHLHGLPITVVPDRWLHATVLPVTGIPATDLDPTQRRDLTTALHDQLAGVPPFTLTAGPPLAGSTAVMIDLDGDLPGQPWHHLVTAVRTAYTQVLGPDAASARPGPPHLTVGYATADCDSGDLQSWLRRHVRPARAPLTVDTVHLLDVTQTPDTDAAYTWQPWATIPLTPPR